MRTFLAIVLLVVLPVSAVAQQPGATDPEAKAPRRTPLGTQVSDLPERVKPKFRPEPTAVAASPAEPTAQLLERAAVAHNASALLQKTDSVAEGTLTYLGGDKVTFPVTVVQKGTDKILRIVRQPSGDVRQGSNGKETWNAFQGFLPVATGSPLHFIESQTSRSVRSLLQPKPGSVVRDVGMKGDTRVVESEDSQQNKTSYVFDPGSARVTRLEFEVGQSRNPFNGQSVPVIESFEFSDFRMVDGVLTPFKIERYLSGVKTEEIQFNSVRYNTGVRDDAFKP